MQHNPRQLAPCNWSQEHFPWPLCARKSGVHLWWQQMTKSSRYHWHLWTGLDFAPRLINVLQMLHAEDDKRLVAGEGMQMVISSQGHVVDRFICFSIQSLRCQAFGTSANSPSLFWGYCSNLVSLADKGIHLAANPFSDSDQVSEAVPFRSKYLFCLISKILPA